MDENKIQEALHLLHDTHASVLYQCCIVASLEYQSSLKAKEEIPKTLSTIQGDFLQFLSDRDNLFELADIWYVAPLKDE